MWQDAVIDPAAIVDPPSRRQSRLAAGRGNLAKFTHPPLGTTQYTETAGKQERTGTSY